MSTILALRREAALGLSTTLLVACASPAPLGVPGPDVPAQPTAASPSVVPSASPPAVATSLPSAVVAEPPLPSAPPGVDAEKLRLAASICAVALDGDQILCRSRPPFSDPKPDGTLPSYYRGGTTPIAPGELPRDGEPDILQMVVKGSFTRPGATQAVLGFCSWNASIGGDSALVEETGGRWKALAFGPPALSCLASRRADGHDVLLCQGGVTDACPNIALHSRALFLVDHAGGKERRETFADLPTPNLACWFHGVTDTSFRASDMSLPGGLVSLEVTAFRLADLNHDGVDDLVVEITYASAAASRSLDLRAGALCKKQGPGGTMASLLPPAKKARLEFVSDENHMRPTDATAKLLAALN